jgi:tetratricopeptide (TPR) repeat protein
MPPIATEQQREQNETRMLPNSTRLSPDRLVTEKRSSSRSVNKKSRHSQNDSSSESSSVSSYYKSDRSVSMRDASKRSLGSNSLVGFYSSRRSLGSRRPSNKSIGKSTVIDCQNRAFDQTWNKKEGEKPDVSPRRPIKRSSIVIENESVTANGNSSSDRAPRQPYNRRFSIKLESESDSQNSHDKSPRQPRQRRFSNNNSIAQDIYVSFPTTASSKTDMMPKQPQKRRSFFEGDSSRQEIQFTPEPIVERTESKKEEIDVSPPICNLDLESISGSVIEGSGSSVTSDITSPSEDEKQYSRLKMSAPPSLSKIYQQNLMYRRQASQRSLNSFPSYTEKSIGTRESNKSTMSVQSHLSLSIKIQTLLELTSEVVNAENLDDAAKSYQKSIHSAASEIMGINIQMGNMLGDECSASVVMRNACHEDLRLIGIIIGLLRTKMAIMYGDVGEYERAVDLCRGAVQVHMHQPVLKSISSNLSDMVDVAGLMVLIIERLENAQRSFEGHKELLDKIDQYSTSTPDNGASSSPKVIVLDMLERSKDGSSILRDNDTLEILSAHTAKQDKHDEGIMFLRDALQIHLVALGLKHPRTSKSLLHVARMYRGSENDRNNESLVLGYFQQTAAVLQRSYLSQQSRVSVLNDIAVIHMRRKVFDEAIKFLLDALHAYDENADEDSEKRGHHIATLQVWRNLGECYMLLFKFKSAEGAFLKALHIQRDCIKIHETAQRLELNAMKISQSVLKLANDTCIADTICRIGKARAGGGNHKQALDVYREALRVLNRNSAADKDRTDVELLEKRDQLTHLLYCIAESERANDENEKALQMYNLSLRLRKSNGAEQTDKRKVTRIHCLSCSLGIIDVLVKQKRFDETKKEIKGALGYAINFQVKHTHPVVLAIRKKAKDCEQAISDAAMGYPDIDALEKKADAEIERGALDMATETLKQLLVIRRATLKQLKEKGHDTKDQVYAIACLLQTFGFVFAKNGDDENAERAFKDASRLFRKGGTPDGANLTQL